MTTRVRRRKHRSHRFFGALSMALLSLVVGGCTSPEGVTIRPDSTRGPQSSIPTSISGASNAAGIEAVARVVSSSEASSTVEVKVTTHFLQLQQTCSDDEDCAEQREFLVRSSVLLDYHLSALADATELVVDNEVDATSSVTQVLTFNEVEPGDHCLAFFSQILEFDEGDFVGREGLIGAYQYETLGSGESENPSTSTQCSTSGLRVPEGEFVSSEGSGCGGLPNGITSDLDRNELPDNELLVLVPTCRRDLVVVILEDGELRPDLTRLVPGQDEDGFLAFHVPRPAGRWRAATLPVEQYRDVVPNQSAYWDVVISPPREF